MVGGLSGDGRELKRKALHGVLGGLFLIGLAVLFYLDALWPWVLALVGALVIAEAVVQYLT